MEQIKLNTIPSGVPSVCHISQFDNTSRIIRCHLFNGSDPLTLTGSETIRLFMRKSDNSRAEFEIESVSGSFIDLVITSEMSDIAGDSECKFQITDSEKTIGTLNFKMIVEYDAYGDSLKTRSVSGPIATFETDLAEDLIKLDVDLEPIQDLHGYDNPWPAGGGKNILKTSGLSLIPPSSTAFSNVTKRTFAANSFCLGLTSSNYFQNNKVTQYLVEENNISVTSSANAYAVIIPITNLNIGETYTLSTSISQGKMSAGFWEEDGTFISFTPEVTDGVLSFTVPQNTFYVGLSFNPRTNDVQATFTNIQLEKGSTATSYAPYSNICPISGHDSAKLFRTGKNLFDNQFPDISTSAKYRQIKVKNGTYTASTDCPRNSDGQANLWVLEGYKTSGASTASNGLWEGRERVLTITDGYITVVYRERDEAANPVNHRTQIELGSTATAYEPYESDPTPITIRFGQTIYKGMLDAKNGKIIATHTARTIKTFPWTWYEAEAYFGYFATGNTTDKAYNTNYICECFNSVNKARGSLENGELGVYNLTNGSRRFVIRYDSISTVEALIEQFGNYLICYELETPIEIDLTQIQTASIDSTPVASFETTLAMPLNSSEHSFTCSQAEGTPTPDSPIPITGVSEITAIRTGKNICPIFTAYSGNGLTTTVNPDGTIHVTGTATGSGGFITVSNVLGCVIPTDQQITVSISNTIPARLRQFIGGVNQNSTSDINAGEKSTTFSRNFKIASISLYLFTTAGQSYDFSFKFQIELGSSATPYEPYSGESITVSLGGTYYGGKLVQSEDGSRKIVLDKTFTKISALTWTYVPSFTYFNAYPTNLKQNSNAGITLDGLTSDIYTNRTAAQAGSGDIDLSIAGYQTAIRIKHKAYTDVNSFVTAVGDHDIVYPLETPIEIDLPDGDPLTTLAGENNVYCNTGDTALAYYYNMVADPIRIPALVGTNNVYSDAGDVDVEYYTTLEGGND